MSYSIDMNNATITRWRRLGTTTIYQFIFCGVDSAGNLKAMRVGSQGEIEVAIQALRDAGIAEADVWEGHPANLDAAYRLDMKLFAAKA